VTDGTSHFAATSLIEAESVAANNAICTLNLLTVNIQAGLRTRRYSDYLTRSWSHALPVDKKRISLDTIAELVGAYDIVGLQEADPGSLRSGFANQTHYLAQQAGFAYWSHQTNRRVGRVASSGNGLLSRLQPLEVHNHPLPGRFKGRGVLLARFGRSKGGLIVAVAHLSLGTATRLWQLDFIADLLADYPNVILMGDFNCPAEHPEMQVLYRKTRLQPPICSLPTFPSWRPERAIDHILISTSLCGHSVQAIPAAFSDHLALALAIDVPADSLY